MWVVPKVVSAGCEGYICYAGSINCKYVEVVYAMLAVFSASVWRLLMLCLRCFLQVCEGCLCYACSVLSKCVEIMNAMERLLQFTSFISGVLYLVCTAYKGPKEKPSNEVGVWLEWLYGCLQACKCKGG